MSSIFILHLVKSHSPEAYLSSLDSSEVESHHSEEYGSDDTAHHYDSDRHSHCYKPQWTAL